MKLSKRTQKEVDIAMGQIHNGNVLYGCMTMAALHRCGNAKEQAIIEEYRDNNVKLHHLTHFVNGCMVAKDL